MSANLLLFRPLGGGPAPFYAGGAATPSGWTATAGSLQYVGNDVFTEDSAVIDALSVPAQGPALDGFLTLTNWPSLQVATLFANDMTGLHVENCPALTTVNFQHSPCAAGVFAYLDFANALSLTALDLAGMEVDTLIFPPTDFSALVNKPLSVKHVELTYYTSPDDIYLDSLSIETADLHAPLCQYLYIDNNPLLSALDLSGFNGLIQLECSDCSIASLSANCAYMQYCWVVSNLLTSLDISGSTVMLIVDAADNLLTSLVCAYFTSMTSLSLYNNTITSIDVTECVELASLNLDNNAMSQATVDSILSHLVTALVNTNVGGFIFIGGTNAAPSGSGLTDVATLNGYGFTVSHN